VESASKGLGRVRERGKSPNKRERNITVMSGKGTFGINSSASSCFHQNVANCLMEGFFANL
jgi:hypothetical protein